MMQVDTDTLPRWDQGASVPPRYVGFWYRVVAFVIDSWLLMLLVGAVVFTLEGWESALEWREVYARREWIGSGISELLVTWLLPAVVTILFWEYALATPGKLLIGARIVDATTLAVPSPKQWVIRYLGYFASSLALGLGFLWVAFDPRKQGWHDKLANTVVIFRRNRSADTA